MPERKLPSGTFKTKESQPGLVQDPLFWKSHCATRVPAQLFPHHVTGSCKGPIVGSTSQLPMAEKAVSASQLLES